MFLFLSTRGRGSLSLRWWPGTPDRQSAVNKRQLCLSTSVRLFCHLQSYHTSWDWDYWLLLDLDSDQKFVFWFWRLPRSPKNLRLYFWTPFSGASPERRFWILVHQHYFFLQLECFLFSPLWVTPKKGVFVLWVPACVCNWVLRKLFHNINTIKHKLHNSISLVVLVTKYVKDFNFCFTSGTFHTFRRW